MEGQIQILKKNGAWQNFIVSHVLRILFYLYYFKAIKQNKIIVSKVINDIGH